MDSHAPVYTTTAVHIHEDFNQTTLEYDIAIIRLSKSLVFSNKIQAISLPNQGDDVVIGMVGIISGWGLDDFKGSVQLELKEAQINVLSTKKCNNFLAGTISKDINPDSVFCGATSRFENSTCLVSFTYSHSITILFQKKHLHLDL